MRFRSTRVSEIAVARCAALLDATLDARAGDAIAHPVDPFAFVARVDVRVRSHMPGESRIDDRSHRPCAARFCAGAKIDRDFPDPIIQSAKGLGYRLDAV